AISTLVGGNRAPRGGVHPTGEPAEAPRAGRSARERRRCRLAPRANRRSPLTRRSRRVFTPPDRAHRNGDRRMKCWFQGLALALGVLLGAAREASGAMTNAERASALLASAKRHL